MSAWAWLAAIYAAPGIAAVVISHDSARATHRNRVALGKGGHLFNWFAWALAAIAIVLTLPPVLLWRLLKRGGQ